MSIYIYTYMHMCNHIMQFTGKFPVFLKADKYYDFICHRVFFPKEIYLRKFT